MVDGKLITVVAPSEQAAIGVNYISKRYKIPLQVTICVLTGMEECEVRFVLEKDLPKKTEKTLLMINRFRIHVTKRRI